MPLKQIWKVEESRGIPFGGILRSRPGLRSEYGVVGRRGRLHPYGGNEPHRIGQRAIGAKRIL